MHYFCGAVSDIHVCRLHLQIKRDSETIICLLTGAALLLSPFRITAAESADGVSVERTETVYVTADASGKPREVLSSVYLVNPDGRETIEDASSLTDVKCLTQNKTPVRTDSGWSFAAGGEDVSYQGTADAAGLPVSMTVTYSLDGAEMSPEEIAGKAGHVRVTVRYSNNLRNTVTLKGKQVELCTPLTVITMIELDDSFKNITVQNAKLMTDAGASTVMGTTFPGLAESLDTDAKDSLSETFSFEANTKSFSMESITAVVVTGLLNADDLGSMDDLEDFVTGVDDLNEAGEDLTDGAKALYRGLRKYAEGMDDFTDGIEDLENGADSLHSAVSSIDMSGLNRAVSAAKDAAGDAADDISSALGKIQSSLDPEVLAEISGALSDLGDALRNAKTAEGILKEIPSVDLDDLKDGTKKLAKGVETLHKGASALTSSAGKLESGARSLYRGLRDFYNDGLQELDEQTDGLSVAVDRKDAILDLGEAYTAYSSEPVEKGSVKFMYTTDSIYVPKVQAPAEDESSQEEAEAAETSPESGPTASDVFERFEEFFKGLFGIRGD